MRRAPRGVYLPPNSLARIIGAPDGKSFEDLVAAAEANVERLKPLGVTVLHDKVRELVELCERPEDIVFGESPLVARIAAHVAEDAAQVGDDEIAQTARGVSAMMNALFEQGIWHSEALEVHVQALKVLASHLPLSQSQKITMQRELFQMRQSIGVWT